MSLISVISVIPQWSGSDDTVTLDEFLESIESSGRIGRWTENDQREVAVLKLTGSAKLFYQCCDELHEQGATWQLFKEAFRQWYRDVHMEQYHFTKLQTARQGKNESPQQFADRCKNLAQKVMIKSADSQIQRIHKENAYPMLLASFVSGLTGTAGYQLRISHPGSLEEALNLTVSVQEAERQERFNENFYTQSKNQCDYCPNRGADRNQETEIVGIRVKHARIGKRAASARVHPLVKIGQSTRRTEKRERKPGKLLRMRWQRTFRAGMPN